MIRRRVIAFVAATAAFVGVFAAPAAALTTTNIPSAPPGPLGLVKFCITVTAADQRLCINL